LSGWLAQLLHVQSILHIESLHQLRKHGMHGEAQKWSANLLACCIVLCNDHYDSLHMQC